MESKLDKAIAAYRKDPTEQNKKAVLAAQQEQTTDAFRRDADEYIRRTK